ncbi:lipoprotein [Rhizobium sp. YS-1r]|nr:lipoprotein [Rhizobium sp. YS-1r]
MTTTSAFRVGMGVAGILASTLTLSGCLGSPTYGTDKTALEQLTDDLGSAVSIGGKEDEAKRNLKYNPRPSLVVAKGDAANLPPPQQSLANRENNPNWVESPEETRKRLREEADANANNPRYQSPLITGKGQGGQLTESEKWEAFRKAKQDAETVDVSARRRSLTEPPAEFRSADTANLSDLGEPEMQKEKRRKKEATEAKNSREWWKLF